MAIVFYVKKHKTKYKVHLKAIHGQQLACTAFKKLASHSACKRWINEFLNRPVNEQEQFISRHIIYNDDGTPKVLDKDKVVTKVQYHRLEHLIGGEWIKVLTHYNKQLVIAECERLQQRLPTHKFRVRQTSHRNIKMSNKDYTLISSSLQETYDYKNIVGLCNPVNKTDYRKKQKKTRSLSFWNKK